MTLIGYYSMIHFHPDSVSGVLLEIDERSSDKSREFSLERGNGGADIMCRDDGGGRDIIFLFSAIL